MVSIKTEQQSKQPVKKIKNKRFAFEYHLQKTKIIFSLSLVSLAAAKLTRMSSNGKISPHLYSYSIFEAMSEFEKNMNTSNGAYKQVNTFVIPRIKVSYSFNQL